MRVIVMLLFLSFAGTCFANDPLESLNTVEDTLRTMESTLRAQGIDLGEGRMTAGMAASGAAGDYALGELFYFVSSEQLGPRPWMAVRPCEEGEAELTAQESEACGAGDEERPSAPTHLWRSRPALLSDLRPGVVVVATDRSRVGEWYLAKVTDTSELGSGYLSISAPFKAQVRNVRIVE